MSEEIQAWYENYQRQQQAERVAERREAAREAAREEKRSVVLRQLRARFGELPAAAVTRVEAADMAQLDRWVERVLVAPTLADMLDDPS